METNSTVLSPSLPRIYSCEFLSDSGLYIISCELVRHFTASLEKEEVVNKIIIRLKSCATPRGWDVLLNAIRGGRGRPLLLNCLFLNKRLGKGFASYVIMLQCFC